MCLPTAEIVSIVALFSSNITLTSSNIPSQLVTIVTQFKAVIHTDYCVTDILQLN